MELPISMWTMNLLVVISLAGARLSPKIPRPYPTIAYYSHVSYPPSPKACILLMVKRAQVNGIYGHGMAWHALAMKVESPGLRKNCAIPRR